MNKSTVNGIDRAGVQTCVGCGSPVRCRNCEAESAPTERSHFRDEIEKLINFNSLESGSYTPDFLLAEYLSRSLELFDHIVNRRKEWYGRKTKPAKDNSVGDQSIQNPGQQALNEEKK